MKNQDYHSSITVSVLPKEAFDKISHVSDWWSLHFEGSSYKFGDTFTVRFKSGDWFTVKINELTPGKKIVWDIIGAEQTWLEKRNEWVGTRIVWNISQEKNSTKVSMKHLGLTPEFECYDNCKRGWDYLLKQSLYKYLVENKGLPV